MSTVQSNQHSLSISPPQTDIVRITKWTGVITATPDTVCYCHLLSFLTTQLDVSLLNSDIRWRRRFCQTFHPFPILQILFQFCEPMWCVYVSVSSEVSLPNFSTSSVRLSQGKLSGMANWTRWGDARLETK